MSKGNRTKRKKDGEVRGREEEEGRDEAEKGETVYKINP
jgi:hypothetical protein